MHLFDNNGLNWKLEDGTPIQVTQNTRYPWDGKVELTISPASAKEFTLHLRRPLWAGTASVSVAGVTVAAPALDRGYFSLKRTWKPGEKVVVQFDMAPRVVVSNELIRDNIGKAAVERGPLVYCMESLDQPEGASVFDWRLDSPAGKQPFTVAWKPDLLGGVVTLAHRATRPVKPDTSQPLYDLLSHATAQASRPGEVTLVPYYTFHNREITAMQVWIPYREAR